MRIWNTKTNSYLALQRTPYDDNQFEVTDNSIYPVAFPVTVSITSYAGDTVVDRIPNSGSGTAPPNGVVVNGLNQVQFPATA